MMKLKGMLFMRKVISLCLIFMLFSGNPFFGMGVPLGEILYPSAYAEDNIFTDNVGIGEGSPTSRIHGNTLLEHATNNEVAYELDYTTNKAAGNDTGLVINMTDTLSPGTSYLLDLQVGGGSKLTVDAAGNLVAQGTISGTISGYIKATNLPLRSITIDS